MYLTVQGVFFFHYQVFWSLFFAIDISTCPMRKEIVFGFKISLLLLKWLEEYWNFYRFITLKNSIPMVYHAVPNVKITITNRSIRKYIDDFILIIGHQHLLFHQIINTKQIETPAHFICCRNVTNFQTGPLKTNQNHSQSQLMRINL